MASQKEKFEQDAERAKTRGFGGYLLDRATGRADFAKSATAAPQSKADTAPAAPPVIGGKSMSDDLRKEVGMKKGGAVRGWGAARGARAAKYK